MIGIDRKQHEVLQERIKRLEELSAHSRDSELRCKQRELEKQMRLLCEQFSQYTTQMQALAVIVESYTKLYSDTSISAYQLLRKARAKKRA